MGRPSRPPPPSSMRSTTTKKGDRHRRLKRIQDMDNSKMLDLLKTESAGFLEAEGMERTFRIPQEDITEAVALQSAKKRFDLKLESGPYEADYTRDGRYLLLSGRRGHVAAMEWERGKLYCELDLDETVRSAKWLQNHSFFAVAQKNNVYIYDTNGSEVHRLQKGNDVDYLEYLPFHFLLSSMNSHGWLRYQDVTTGQIVAEHHSTLGRCHSMRQNPSNAIIHLGHAGGIVSLWSPSISGPLVTMQCHPSPVTAIALDPRGSYMATSGLDGRIKVWDLRTYRQLHEYFPTRPATSLDISQRGLLAACYGPHVTLWKDGLGEKAKEPYLHHLQAGAVTSSVKFAPFDDILGIGHSDGFSSILTPGSGEPNYDSYEANPFASRNQRREAEVKQLLDKLPPETIMLDPSVIGTVARTEEEKQLLRDVLTPKARAPTRSARKKSKQAKDQEARRKRQDNIIDEERVKKKEIIVVNNAPPHPGKKTALDRFKLKSL